MHGSNTTYISLPFSQDTCFTFCDSVITKLLSSFGQTMLKPDSYHQFPSMVPGFISLGQHQSPPTQSLPSQCRPTKSDYPWLLQVMQLFINTVKLKPNEYSGNSEKYSTYILKSSSSSSSRVFISCSGRETIGSNWGSWLESSAFSVEVSCSSCTSWGEKKTITNLLCLLQPTLKYPHLCLKHLWLLSS